MPAWFRRAFPYSRWGAELNARITPRFFAWLVGPMEVAEATLADGTAQRSAVKIERCRCAQLPDALQGGWERVYIIPRSQVAAVTVPQCECTGVVVLCGAAAAYGQCNYSTSCGLMQLQHARGKEVHVGWSRAPAAPPSRGPLSRPRPPSPVCAML